MMLMRVLLQEKEWVWEVEAVEGELLCVPYLLMIFPFLLAQLLAPDSLFLRLH